MKLHSYKMISDINSQWGITKGNPIHDTIREIATNNPVDFSVDITINRDKGITSIHAGEMAATHRDACQFAKITAMQKVPHKFDLVITTNSGYPLDLNLYQAIKGISAASLIVREGGAIICAAECSDGIPDHGLYKDILKNATSPDEILRNISTPDHNKQDQWQAQIQAQIQSRCDVYIKSGFLSDEQVKKAHLNPISNIQETITELGGQSRNVSICILPEGPQTIPYVED
jgi:nickel-dependent lactate racemase